jgi:hypothetical protein
MPTQKEINQLFQDTKLAFEQSAIKQFAEERNLKWNYAISSTQLIPHTNLIVGFNSRSIHVVKGQFTAQDQSIPAFFSRIQMQNLRVRHESHPENFALAKRQKTT